MLNKCAEKMNGQSESRPGRGEKHELVVHGAMGVNCGHERGGLDCGPREEHRGEDHSPQEGGHGRGRQLDFSAPGLSCMPTGRGTTFMVITQE